MMKRNVLLVPEGEPLETDHPDIFAVREDPTRDRAVVIQEEVPDPLKQQYRDARAEATDTTTPEWEALDVLFEMLTGEAP